MSATQNEATPKRRQFRVPHVFVILFILIIAAVILSYFAPAGEYTRITTDGRTVIDIDSYRNVPNQPLSFSNLITLVPDSMVASVIVMLIFSVAGLEIILGTKAIDSFLLSFVMRNKGKELMIVCIVAVAYGLVGAILGWTYGFVPFIPITIAVAHSLGFDTVFGAGMILLPAASGWSSGVVNVYTTAVAQSIAGLPTFSGMGFRIFGFVVFMAVTLAFLIRKASQHRVRPDGETEGIGGGLTANADLELTGRRKLVCLWTLLGFAFLIYTTITLRWGNLHIAGIFMFIGIIGGFLYGFNPDEISELFIKGTKGIMAGALTVGIARAVMMVMEKTMLLDSLVHALGEILKLGGSITGVVLMCVVVTLFNGLVSSANGKVVTMVPIMVPLADILGIRRQAVVLAFCYGDGFTNWFWPTAGVIVASLGAAKVRYEDWMRFSWKIFLIYTAVSCLLVAIAQIVHLGPF